MRILSNEKRGANGLPYPMKCIVCGKIVFYTAHTVYGHQAVCLSHTDKELEKVIKGG